MTHATPNAHTAQDNESPTTNLKEDIKPLPPGTVNRGRDDREYVAIPFAQIAMSDIRRAYESLADKYPPVLNLKQAAEISGVATSTLKRHISEGRYKDCVSRGKPLRFWRDKFVQEAMKDK